MLAETMTPQLVVQDHPRHIMPPQSNWAGVGFEKQRDRTQDSDSLFEKQV